MGEKLARCDGRRFDEATLAKVEQITNAALYEVGFPAEHRMVFDDEGIGWFNGDADPGDEWDEAIEKALTLAWSAVGTLP